MRRPRRHTVGAKRLRRGRRAGPLAVLVGAGEKKRVVAQQAMAARDDVGGDGGVGVADVGAGVDVVDRRGEVKLFGRLWHRLERLGYQGSRFREAPPG